MSDNIDQFAIYSAKIFQMLYDSFPVTLVIDRDEIINEYLTFNQGEELKSLNLKKSVTEILSFVDDSDEIKSAQDRLPDIKNRITELENEKRGDRDHQIQVYSGTFNFLISEGLIREGDPRGCQLTSKGFSHLNKSFKDGAITSENKTHIAALKTIFEKSSDTSLQVAAGTAVNVVTRILGYG